MGAAEADRTLFVGNLDPRATEELLFELFLQAGPAMSVKIPKDKDGKPKQFAFVNFKHEESVPYGMNLLNGIKLFGRPLKIQYRSGSKHLSQDGNVSNSNMNCNGSPTNGSRYERNGDQMKSPGYSSVPQRPYSSPDNLQRQAVVNNMWQQAMAQPSFSTSSSQMYYNQCGQSSQQSSQRYDSSSQQKSRVHGSHPYLNNGHHYSREVRYRGNHEEHYYEERARENRWRSSRN